MREELTNRQKDILDYINLNKDNVIKALDKLYSSLKKLVSNYKLPTEWIHIL